jgi:microcystin-dependent protein
MPATNLTNVNSSGNAIGSIHAHSGATAPIGYLLCQGQTVSRTTFASLFAVIGTTYGAGDGSTTFALPNTQGIFLRGSGSQAIGGVTASATLGSTQGDQFQGHYHSVGAVNTANGGSAAVASSNAAANQAFTGAAANIVTDGSNGTPRFGTETRPANVGVNYMIAYI